MRLTIEATEIPTIRTRGHDDPTTAAAWRIGPDTARLRLGAPTRAAETAP